MIVDKTIDILEDSLRDEATMTLNDMKFGDVHNWILSEDKLLGEYADQIQERLVKNIIQMMHESSDYQKFFDEDF